MTTHRLPAVSWVQIWLHGKLLLLKQKLFYRGLGETPGPLFLPQAKIVYNLSQSGVS